MNRRSLLKLVAGFLGAKALAPLAPPPVIQYTLDDWAWEPLNLPEPGTYPVEITYSYWYTYRNQLTGHVSDPSPVYPPKHTFMTPEHDVVDVYRKNEAGELEYIETGPSPSA